MPIRLNRLLSSFQYLEFHRGTYTTQGLVKQGNRKAEVLIRDVEMLGVMATIESASTYR